MTTGGRFGTILAVAGLLSACGGGGGGGGNGGTAGPGGSDPPTTATCSIRDRQNWAAAQLREWYLFPETLPASLDPAGYASVQAYIDALTANARSQGRDRFFTYLTSITEENAFYNSGASTGFGFRLTTGADSLVVTESFEGAPALAAGIDRGARIEAIGQTVDGLRTVAQILAAEGADGVTNALGPSTPGITRVLRVTDATGTRNVTVTKAEFEILPVSTRYGAQIINDGGRRVGYVNLRSFITTADQALRNTFAQFRAAGVTEVIVDLRYNGGGLVSIAELFGDLLGGNRATSDVFSYTIYRPEKAAENETRYFRSQSQSIAPLRIAFIGTRGTASASELVINAFTPYLRANSALIGTDTFGKPVGQIARDRAQCDDRLRVVAFAGQNAARQGDYYNGLANRLEATCQAGDDVSRQLGDPQEASIRTALDFLAGRGCTAIGGAAARGQALRAQQPRELLSPEQPSTAQREVPGLF